MIYSCFDPRSGLYDYHETSEQIPINADLPVPTHLGPEINGIGVPAIEAGRPMPAGARPVGRGWNARGMIADCGRSPMGLSDFATPPIWKMVIAAGMVAAVLWAVGKINVRA